MSTLVASPVPARAFAARSHRHRRHFPSHSRSFAASSTAFSSADALDLSRTASRTTNPAPQPGKQLRMIMFGKPGAGKGTLTSRLVEKYDIMSLSSGDLLRQHTMQRTEIGRIAEEIMAGGGLLPDDVMLKVVTTKLDELRSKHWILDGFPRTLGQGELLDTHLRNQDIPLSLIVNLDVDDQVILSRISDRWVHLPSGRVYNMSYNRPKVEGHDDVTGEPLSKRPDDNPEIFARRLKQFYASTEPLISYFASRSPSSTKLVSLQGKTSDEIWPQLESVVRGLFPSIQERAPETEVTKKRSSLSDAVMGRQKAGNVDSKSWVPP